MTIIGYARVSTLEQRLDVQLSQLKAAGCEVIHEEKASGGKRDRPVLKRLLATVKPGDTVIVMRMDRLARSLVDMLNILDGLRAKGVGFRSLRDPIDTTTSHGLLQLQIMAAIAEFERRLIKDRVLAGVALARAQGRRGGNPKMIARDPEALDGLAKARHAAYVARVSSNSDEWMPVVRKARADGKTWQEVTEAVNKTALPAGAEPWSPSALRRAVRSIAPDDKELEKRISVGSGANPEGAHAIRIIAKLRRKNPAMKLQEMASMLDDLDIPTARGRAWSTSSVHRLVEKARAQGMIPT